MSNPTTHVESFAGLLGSLSGVEPIRYSGGLWLEEAVTNIHPNPRPTTTDSGAIGSGATITRDTSVRYGADAASWKVACPGSIASEGIQLRQTGLSVQGGNAWSGQTKVIGPAGKVVRHWLRFLYSDTTLQDSSVLTLTLSGDWQDIVRQNVVSNGAKTISAVLLMVRNNAAEAYEFNCTRVQIEERPYATSVAIGDLGAGYAHTGTPYQSASTRAASSAAISPTGILSPASGALAFRATPTIETGLEEIWGECGVKGAATDHTQWGRDATKHPFVEWSANNAAYQRITATETVDAETEYFLYFGYNGTDTYLQVDSGTPQTGTRDVVEDDFSVGDLTLEASAGGVIVSPFATFDRPLTDTEIATLAARQGWSMSTLGSTTRRIRAQFELRPAY